jgi:hypothetical protein
MAYIILIWMITIILTVWILFRVHLCNKYLKNTHGSNLEVNSMIEYVRSKYYSMTIIIILAWWISFILLESFRLNFIQHQLKVSYQIFALLFISPLIIYIQLKGNQFIKRKYNTCIINTDLRIEFALILLTSIIYSQILSFAIESIMIIAV